MPIRQSVNFSLGQQLTLTPRLQQAIRLLQLSTLELNQEIQTALESNVMLDIEEEGGPEPVDTISGANQLNNENSERSSVEPSGETSVTSVESERGQTEEMAVTDADQPLNERDFSNAENSENIIENSTWDNYYNEAGSRQKGSGAMDNDQVRPIPATQTLQEQLLEQLNLNHWSDGKEFLASIVVDSVDEDGYLRISAEDIFEVCKSQGYSVEIDQVHNMIANLQKLEPAGIGARDIAECLSIQLRQLDDQTKWKDEALDVVNNHLNLLAGKSLDALRKAISLSIDEVKEVVELIRQMNPRPCANIVQSEPNYIVPDVTVFKRDGIWQAALNQDALPKLKINSQYSSLIRQIKQPSEAEGLKTQLQEARWLIKSLNSRGETLLRVAQCITEEQQEFFNKGPEAMRPLVLNDVAAILGMHESTISRVTSNKYMHTPRGIYALKYFFSSSVQTSDGSTCSSTAIRALLQKYIEQENHKKPLSDSKLAVMLAKDGYNVARRTVAKYRDGLGIPSYRERKVLF